MSSQSSVKKVLSKAKNLSFISKRRAKLIELNLLLRHFMGVFGSLCGAAGCFGYLPFVSKWIQPGAPRVFGWTSVVGNSVGVFNCFFPFVVAQWIPISRKIKQHASEKIGNALSATENLALTGGISTRTPTSSVAELHLQTDTLRIAYI